MDISKFFTEVIDYSMGCTEPAAVGLSVATAFSALNGRLPLWLDSQSINNTSINDFKVARSDIKELIIRIDKDTFRNAINVNIPNSEGLKGPINAAVLGLFSDSNRKLELFENGNNIPLEKVKEIIHSNRCKIIPQFDWHGLRIDAELKTKNHSSLVRIQGGHSNITLIQVDKNKLFENKLNNLNYCSPLSQLKSLSIKDMIKIIEELPDETLDLLKESLKVNFKAFEESKDALFKDPTNSLGLKLSELINEEFLPDDFLNNAKYKVVTAIEGRMKGLSLQIMTCAGSGNIGLTVSLTMDVLNKQFKKGESKLLRSLALTHLITNFASTYSGYISALCGCSIKAGIGLAVGILYYFLPEALSIDEKLIKFGAAINNVIESLTGVICDGAKKGCALKVISSIDAAITSAFLALKTETLDYCDGIINKDPIISLKNIEKISKAMTDVDNV
ncbi:MAG: L-serine ammonia-lyase, iron-sulfur-dependent, subunit alpha, partial [Candidatus Lokiarchaeota archaeon]